MHCPGIGIPFVDINQRNPSSQFLQILGGHRAVFVWRDELVYLLLREHRAPHDMNCFCEDSKNRTFFLRFARETIGPEGESLLEIVPVARVFLVALGEATPSGLKDR